MTPDLTEKLARIRAMCERVIEMAEKATPGPWREGTENVWQDDLLIPVCEMRHRERARWHKDNSKWRQEDAAFIAFSRSFTPAAARAVVIALNALEKQAEPYECRHEAFSSEYVDGLNLGYATAADDAIAALESLAATFSDNE